ncbi:MAG: hypothetical protein LBK75_10325 [Oscillospiraceae bacterium]|jgi:hypothetical protein|nr:hypothetical protein [Oscillospiraceae bacterium]
MNVSREQLHDLINIVDASEFDVLYHVLSKFIPEDTPTSNEIEAIEIGREAFRQGDCVRHEDIDWN